VKAGTTIAKLLCAKELPKYFLKFFCGVIVDKCNRRNLVALAGAAVSPN